MMQSTRRKAADKDHLETVHPTNGTSQLNEANGGSPSSNGNGHAFLSQGHTQVMQTERANRVRRAVKLTCQAIIRSYDEDAMLSGCCRYLAEEGGYKVAWIGLSSKDDPPQIVSKAHTGLALTNGDQDRLAGTTQTLLQKTALRCIETRTPQVVRPSESNGSNGSPHGLQDLQLTVCAIPMEIGAHGKGVLVLCIDDPEAFKAEEMVLLRELADDLSHGSSMLMDRAIAEQREKQLLQDREFHDSLFNHTQEGIFLATTGGRLIRANPAFARLMGYPDAESLLGDRSASLYTIFTPEEKNRLMAGLEDHAAPRTHELNMRRKDSAYVSVKVSVQPVQRPQGQFLQAFVQDLSALLEERRKCSKYAAMVKALHTPAFNVNAGRSIGFWDEAAERHYGFKSEKIIGRRYPEAILNGDHEAAQ